MKCPECGGAPTDELLMSMPTQRRCSACGYTGTDEQWMATELREAAEVRDDKMKTARERIKGLVGGLFWQNDSGGQLCPSSIADLIDAKVTLALLERGGG